MRAFFAFLLAAALLCLARDVRAGVEGAEVDVAPTVDLYTIGPHGDFPSRLGHAILCTREAGHDDPEHGHCYDYGVPESEDMIKVGWTAMRGTPSFRPIVIGEPTILHFFKETQGRQVEKQRIPLTPEETKKLVASLDKEVNDEVAYAYHPYWANCTTKIRDQLDAATGGKLHGVPSNLPPTTLREYFEEGHSGHLGILTAMAIYLGEGSDRVPTAWEAMLLPAVLRDAVAERFGAKPEQIAERMAVVLPTSRALGKIAIFAMAFVLFGVVRLCARKNRVRLGLGIIGSIYGLLAISLELFASLVKWPEISHNWALLLFFPVDFALPYLKGKALPIYLKSRIGLALLMALLEIANVAHQPMLPLVALVILPCLALLSALKERVTVEESAPAQAKAA
jgi:hypothetical protein